MGYLVRAVSGNMWEKLATELDFTAIPPYPITNDLKTDEQNKLSLWWIENTDPENISKATLAYALSRGKFDHVEYIVIPEERIMKDAFTIEDSPQNGDTCEELAYMHRDVVVEDYTKLGVFASIVKEYLNNEDTTDMIEREEVLRNVANKIKNGEINASFFQIKKKQNMKQDLVKMGIIERT